MQFNFDASQYDPAQGVQVWPDNEWIKVVLTNHKAVPLQKDANQGRLLWTIQAIEGPLQGKTQFIGMNLWIDNTNGARDIANRELSALTYVTLGANQGRLNFNDFSELHNIPFYVLSKHGYNQQSKSTQQDWGGYKDVNGNDPGKATPAGVGGAPSIPGAPAGMPAQAPGFAPGAPAAAPAPAFGQPAPAAAPGFGQPAPAPAPGAPAPGQFAAPGAPAFGAPPAQAAPPAFSGGAPAPVPGAPTGFAPGAPAPGGFAPPAGQAPAGSPPWQK